ncbi:MAG: hypothetical protein A7316_10245 [Candidatus Altiarchaeales archaeon WOR_SM1_86-2]|nr:MAG: hypothetical protein A7316_10245 [Candidatus Altiarchaeales archaeon WOR_SM1_86-2]
MKEEIKPKDEPPQGKDTNPKETLGIRKVPTHCIPTGPLLELGLAMMEGGRKYGTHNYRAMGARHSVYHDGIVRHLKAWWEGEDIDPDSGLHHLVKIMGCCAVLRDSQLMGNDIDDRPIRYPGGLNMDKYNKQASDIIDKYPDCKKPFIERDKPVPGGY